MAGRSRKRDPLLIGTICALLVFLIISPAADRTMVLDDRPHLETYPEQNAGLSVTRIAALLHWQDQDTDTLWRPVPKALWALSARATPRTPVTATLITSLLAGLGAALLARLLRRLIPDSPPALLFLALLPFLHPLSADILLPFVAQSDLLAAIGFLGFTLSVTSRFSLPVLAAGVSIGMIGLLSKESILPLLAATPLLAYAAPGCRKIRIRRTAVAAALAALLILLRYALQFGITHTLPFAGGAGGGDLVGAERHVPALELIGRYTTALFTPRTPLADYSHLKAPGTASGLLTATGLGTVLMTTFALLLFLRSVPPTRTNARRLRLQRIAAAGLVTAVLFLSIYLNIVSIGALWAGRFAFIPLIGLTITLVSATLMFRNPVVTRLSLIISALFLLVGAVSISHRAFQWRDPLTLWQSEVERTPHHAFAWKNYAAHLQAEGETTLAWTAIRTATELWPEFGEAWLAQGQIARAVGRPEKADAAFRTASRLLGTHAILFEERARLAASRGDFDDALAFVRNARKITPADPGLEFLEARILHDLKEKNREETAP